MSAEVVSIRARYGRATLFNPNTFTVEADFGGQTYRIPAEGKLVVEGLPANPPPKDKSGNPRLGQGGYYNEPIHADDIVAHLVGEDGKSGRLGSRGVRVLDGVNDDAIIAAAKVEAEKFQYAVDVADEQAHLKAVEIARKEGLPIPDPPLHTREAMLRKQKYEQRGLSLAYKCETCGWAFPTEDGEGGRNTHYLVTGHAKGKVAEAEPEDNSRVKSLEAQVSALTAAVQAMLAPKPKRTYNRKKKADAEG